MTSPTLPDDPVLGSGTDGSRVLLIDLDNCPRQIESLPSTLGHYARVVACHGNGTDPKVPLSLVSLLAGPIREGQLEIVRMQRSGKNAADFGLAFWAGHLAAELPPETEFLVLSQDRDLDHVVDLLRGLGRRAERIAGTSSPPTRSTASAVVSATAAHAAADAYYDKMIRPNHGRPASRKTLLKSIKSHLGKGRKDLRPEQVLASLLEREIVQIHPQGRVSYPLASRTNTDQEPRPVDWDDDIPF